MFSAIPTSNTTHVRARTARHLVVLYVIIHLWNCLTICLSHHNQDFGTPTGAIRGLFACVLADPTTNDAVPMSFGNLTGKDIRSFLGGAEGAWIFTILCIPSIQLIARSRPPQRMHMHGITTAPLLPPPRSIAIAP
jgi:hypothetical protein